MKLPNFREHAGLNRLRRAMGAEYVEQKVVGVEWDPFDKNKIIAQIIGGNDAVVDPSVIDFGDDSTIAINGERVLIYIRDVGSFGSRPKFHIAYCSTLKGMVAGNRGDRYVVSKRTDGIFQINVNTGYAGVQTEHVPLNVCKNCLAKLRYKGYRQYGRDWNKIYHNFKLDEFFEMYRETPTTWRPLLNNETAPPNTYTEDWPEISLQYRESVGWICEQCLISFRVQRQRLHVHHIDGNKANNDSSNLKALCHWCHREQPGHGHMARNP